MDGSKTTTQAPQSRAEQVSTMQEDAPAATPAQGRGLVRIQTPKVMGDMLTNYRDDVEADRVEVSRAMAPNDCTLEPYIDKIISVVGVVMSIGEFENQLVKGQMDEKLRASIVLEDGTVVGTTGKAVMPHLADLIRTRQPGPFAPPVEFEVRRHKSVPPKNPYYSLRRVRVKAAANKGGA